VFHFLQGDWDQLEQSEPTPNSSFSWTFKQSWPILRSIFLIGIPALLYWLVMPIFANESWFDTITGYLIIWVIVNIVWLLDPTAKDKIASFKDVTGLF
jgi:hypothetical protein